MNYNLIWNFLDEKEYFYSKQLIFNLVRKPNEANTIPWPLVLKTTDRCKHVIGCWTVFLCQNEISPWNQIHVCSIHPGKSQDSEKCPLAPKQSFNLLLCYNFPAPTHFLPLKREMKENIRGDRICLDFGQIGAYRH